MSKQSLEQVIKQSLNEKANVTSTPGNSKLPAEGSDPGKHGNDPKAKGKPSPPDKNLTDPKEKLKDIDKVSKGPKAQQPAPNQKGKETFASQGSSKVKVKEEEELDLDDVIFEEEDDDDLDAIEIPEDIQAWVDELDEDDIKTQYAELLAVLAEDDDDDSEDENNNAIEEESSEIITTIRKRITAADVNLEEDVNALFSDEDSDLSEEFQSKAKTIFEAAVVHRVNEQLDEMEEAFKNELAEAIEIHEQELGEKVDSYITYVVEEWMTKNELAIDRGLRSEISEQFLVGLKALFSEHYVEVPEEKVDVMEMLSTEIDDLKLALNEQIKKNMDLAEMYTDVLRDEIILEEVKNLSDNQCEKIKALSEGVEFENEGQFRHAIVTLKESYFPDQNDDSSFNDDEDVDLDLSESLEPNGLTGTMAAYSGVISRHSGVKGYK